jgi:SAM-dependent methyltransferase
VINLSPEKGAVFREAYRVLRTGGRLAISDVVAIAPIPPELRTQAAALAGCIAGAAPIDEVRAMLTAAGFTAIDVRISPTSAEVVSSWLPGIERFVASATIEATKGMNSYYLISDGGTMPYRARIRTPSFAHIQMAPMMSRGLTISDLVVILGSVDFVLADVDR